MRSNRPHSPACPATWSGAGRCTLIITFPTFLLEKNGLNRKGGHAIIGFNHGLPCYVKNMAWQAMIKTYNIASGKGLGPSYIKQQWADYNNLLDIWEWHMRNNCFILIWVLDNTLQSLVIKVCIVTNISFFLFCQMFYDSEHGISMLKERWAKTMYQGKWQAHIYIPLYLQCNYLSLPLKPAFGTAHLNGIAYFIVSLIRVVANRNVILRKL